MGSRATEEVEEAIIVAVDEGITEDVGEEISEEVDDGTIEEGDNEETEEADEELMTASAVVVFLESAAERLLLLPLR